ncbi:MAG: hypothetical protein GY771_15490 [bacterium]|nr:hypothetical protein [bacterium]
MLEPGIEKLNCEAWGAGLHPEPGAGLIRCGYCGTEYRVREHNSGIGRSLLLDDTVYYVETILDGDHYVGEKQPPALLDSRRRSRRHRLRRGGLCVAGRVLAKIM